MYLYGLICFCKQLTRYLEIFHYQVVLLTLSIFMNSSTEYTGLFNTVSSSRLTRTIFLHCLHFLSQLGLLSCIFVQEYPTDEDGTCGAWIWIWTFCLLWNFYQRYLRFLGPFHAFYHRRSQQFNLYILEIPIPVRSNPSLLWF